jgi:type VI secretion system secreted protein VgrG
MNGMYLITSVRHRATQGGDYGTSSLNGADEELSYSNTFECIPYSVQFRPQRTTPRPFVRGCQTAVVVGPAGEEIYTDKYGRVKVQFHWDREGKRDENSSCWIRVSHPWAGQGWGAVSIPRIGQEVIVDFVEGDPDQPIITGRVYNAECMPPYELPAGAMVSGMKSNSTKGGGGYNEISANDTKGKEQITIHGQYDMNTTVQNNKTVTVKSGNRTLTVESGTNTETIKGTASLTVQAGARMVDVTGGDYSAASSDGVFLHGKSKGVGIKGDAQGVSIEGNGKGVGIVGNGEGVSIVGNAKGVGIIGNGEGVGIVGNTKGVGIEGNGEGVGIKGNPVFSAEGTSEAQIKSPKVTIGDGEIAIVGSKIILGAGGGSILIDGGGVTIQGTKVNIN